MRLGVLAFAGPGSTAVGEAPFFGGDVEVEPSIEIAEPAVAGSAVAPLRPIRKLLVRGESAVASIGISLAAILFCTMAACGWWTLHTEQFAASAARAEQVKAVAGLLSQSSESLMAAGELSAVRLLVANAGPSYHLTKCRILLPGGKIAASMDAADSRAALPQLPEKWGSPRRQPAGATVLFDPQGVGNNASLAVTVPMNVPGRGPAELQIEAAGTKPLWSFWDTQTGVGAIGTVAMVALLLVYRQMRSRLRAIGAIRESLLALRSAGGASNRAAVSGLSVSPLLGPEAEAWNDLIDEMDRSRKQSVSDRARETLGRRRQSKGDLESAFDAMSQGLILLDERACVKYANGAAATFLQTDRPDLTGVEMGAVMHVPHVLAAIRDVASGTLRRRTVIDVEGKNESGAPGGGAGVLRFHIRPVRREDSASAMVVIEDVTQQKAAEEARHAFVAQATHELRTPLTNIRLYVETAIEEGENDATIRSKCLNVINSETRRLERIVGEMLSVSEIEAGSFKLKSDDVRLDALFDELKADYSEQAKEKEITFNFVLPPKIPVIQGDRDKMTLALHNLVGNALKYTPSGGTVTVTVDQDAAAVHVAVKDTGIGISAEDVERIFERFYRANDKRVAKITGTGLGLTLAREVARLHGGDITVESQLDQGSTFTLTLPAKAQAA